MSSFYSARVDEFLSHSNEHVLARLNIGYAHCGYSTQYSEQILIWDHDIQLLRQTLSRCVELFKAAQTWGLLLEFSIPRKSSRIDIVLLIQGSLVILETKTANPAASANLQIEEYALLLQYFHKGSADQRIIPLVVSDALPARTGAGLAETDLKPRAPGSSVMITLRSRWEYLPTTLVKVNDSTLDPIDLTAWDTAPYLPVPTIIEAALALRSGLSIREIAHAEASEHEISTVQEVIQSAVDDARKSHHHVICFLTGVPGSGKTLVGLSLAHSGAENSDAIHFMSGNGPLVRVLQHLFTQESMRSGARSVEARTKARTLIENVHVFARHYTEHELGAPSNHAVIFDEAQRAWNREQNRKKFKRDYSEPEMLLRIMERHPDWAAIVALVGGGQEINDGEAGLEEWGRALLNAQKSWRVFASPEVLVGGASTANRRLFSDSLPISSLETNAKLHLRTSNRSLRAERLAEWVNFVLDGDDVKASCLNIAKKFPIVVTRDLEDTRAILRRQGAGENRYGLIGSSGAARLRAEGLEPNSTFHADYPWEHWYLAARSDVRSSFQCEVFATEFEVQGLELDWVGLCWGGDFIWGGAGKGWLLRNLRHGAPSNWRAIRNPQKQMYRKNAYRVLLTRARQGMIIFIPRGNEADPTRSSAEFDQTAEFLIRCGALRFTAQLLC